MKRRIHMLLTRRRVILMTEKRSNKGRPEDKGQGLGSQPGEVSKAV
jgi:hypothetical protein